MARLPVVGGDRDNWGVVLNDYLSVEHNADGSLKKGPTINSAVQSVNGKTGQAVTLTASDVSAISSSVAGVANGVATLGADSRLTVGQIPGRIEVMAPAPSGDMSGVTDTAALQSLIDQAASEYDGQLDGEFAGGRVVLQQGVYYANLVMKPTVSIVGQGWGATRIKAPAGSAAAVIGSPTLDKVIPQTEDNVMLPGVEVAHLTIDGNKNSGATGHGLHFCNGRFWSGNLANFEHDPNPHFHHLYIHNAGGNGMVVDGASSDQYGNPSGMQAMVSNVHIFGSIKNGLHILGPDGQYSNMQIGVSGEHGVLMQSNGMLTNVKAWYSGALALNDVWEYIGRPYDGFYIAGDLWQAHLHGCKAQDNGRYGVHFNAARGIAVKAMSLADDQEGEIVFTGACQDNEIEAYIAYADRPPAAGKPIVILDGAGVQNNHIELRGDRRRLAGRSLITVLNGAIPGSQSWQYQLTNKIQTVSSAGGTVTPNFIDGESLRLSLTGNVTIAAPSTTPNQTYPGQRVTIVIVQDVIGGRTVTWNAAYKNAPVVATGANAVTAVTFMNVSVSVTPEWAAV